MQTVRPRTADMARGRWPGILTALGVEDRFLRDKHGPCPVCGGEDRYRFDDRDGNGTFFCNHCEPRSGDGFALLMKITGKDFASIAKEVEALCHLPASERRGEQSSEEKRAWCRKLWGETLPATLDNTAGLYLFNRLHLEQAPKALRYHHGLKHKDTGAFYPAMVARIINPDGESIGLHRTYLTDSGHKASVAKAKMSFVWKRQEGAAVRLCAAQATMGIAEGIETALAAQLRFGVPCWSGLTAGGVERWIPPPQAKHVTIFGDNDPSYTGQAAAYVLAKRLVDSGIAVEVKIPEKAGEDWADGI